MELSLSHRWALAACQAIDRIPRDRLWPALMPVIDAQIQTSDADDLWRLAGLLAHIKAWPLLEKLVSRAGGLDDPDAREVVDDFTDHYALFWATPPDSGPNS